MQHKTLTTARDDGEERWCFVVVRPVDLLFSIRFWDLVAVVVEPILTRIDQ